MRMTAKKQYSNIIPGNEYTLLNENPDNFEVKVKGRPQFVPKWVFEGKLDRRFEVEDEPEDEFYQMDWQ